jgi:CBS domain-containing protein
MAPPDHGRTVPSMPSRGAEITASYRIPPIEAALVSDAMHPGVFTCEPSVSLRQVCRLMVTYHVHAIVVGSAGDEWSMVTDVDVLAAAGADPNVLTAGDVANSPTLTIAPDEPLVGAARRMAERGVDHMVVIDDGRPAGVISSLDVAGILAWGPR